MMIDFSENRIQTCFFESLYETLCSFTRLQSSVPNITFSWLTLRPHLRYGNKIDKNSMTVGSSQLCPLQTEPAHVWTFRSGWWCWSLVLASFQIKSMQAFSQLHYIYEYLSLPVGISAAAGVCSGLDNRPNGSFSSHPEPAWSPSSFPWTPTGSTVDSSYLTSVSSLWIHCGSDTQVRNTPGSSLVFLITSHVSDQTSERWTEHERGEEGKDETDL